MFALAWLMACRGIYGLTDATIKDVRAPFLLLLGYVYAFVLFLGGSLFFLSNLTTGYTDV